MMDLHYRSQQVVKLLRRKAGTPTEVLLYIFIIASSFVPYCLEIFG